MFTEDFVFVTYYLVGTYPTWNRLMELDSTSQPIEISSCTSRSLKYRYTTMTKRQRMKYIDHERMLGMCQFSEAADYHSFTHSRSVKEGLASA